MNAKLNPFKEVNWHPDTAARRVFAKSLMIGLPCVAVLFAVLRWLKTGAWDSSSIAVYGGAGFSVGALFYALPGFALPCYVVCYGLACCIGFVVSNVAMALIYFGLVTGIGLLKRLGGNQPIRKLPDRQAKSYWLDAPPPSNSRRYFSQY
ncbi:MAG: hypothetical protein EB141_03320 [Verrucomicrobia bacterium]|nr:hypothetical protein [Verrucomicrobiota bacterium]NBU10433.1 hypothetical protein [Pseudomonadota bacterium]NDA65776.1 hypothetical protein [Verrucomicrobiota bacterium]NDB74668.1 hypothetical protein [Verrucomicrobiota bacterium]NDD37644.1 hypothetical protein [Verrucomicrobiota bacterium]